MRSGIGEGAGAGRWWHSWLLFTAIIAGGCTSDSAVTTGPTAVKCQVALAAPSPSIGPDGGTGIITVTAPPECPWNVSTLATWLSALSPTSGQGTGTVEFRAAANPLPSAREADIVVNENRVRVSQAAACRVELRSGSITIGASGGTREVAVSAPGRCSWAAATDASWISFTTPVTGSGEGTVGVSIAPHRGGQSRVGTIVVGGQGVTVTQEPDTRVPGCAYAISSASPAVLPSGGAEVSASVTVASGCAWTASSSVAWVTVLAGASGTGSGTVTFGVAANPGGIRTGTVTIAGQTFTVTQAAAAAIACTYTISPTSVSMDERKGNGTVAVSAGAGCAWTAKSNASWISVKSGASGKGGGSVTFEVSRNDDDDDRTGTLTIAGHTFTVRQQGDDD